MNEDNKKRMEEFKNVLLLVGLITLAIAASFGCFNYATLANKAGDPDNIFWFVGAANIAITLFFAIRGAKRLKDA